MAVLGRCLLGMTGRRTLLKGAGREAVGGCNARGGCRKGPVGPIEPVRAATEGGTQMSFGNHPKKPEGSAGAPAPTPRAAMDRTNTPAGAAEEDTVLFRLEQVSRRFRMGEVVVEALRDVTLDIFRGEFLVVVGPSGSGKTTLLNLIGGLDSPTSGRIWFGGRDLTHFRPAELTQYRRETVGFVFQFYNLVPNLTARENVMVATEISRRPWCEDEALRLVGLEDRSGHFPSQLSGGEQQRVAVARALAKNPSLLLCDEPTGALDFAAGKRILRLLVDLKRKRGLTVVLITHNNAIAPIADRVARLRSGQLVELKENPRPLEPEEVVW